MAKVYLTMADLRGAWVSEDIPPCPPSHKIICMSFFEVDECSFCSDHLVFISWEPSSSSSSFLLGFFTRPPPPRGLLHSIWDDFAIYLLMSYISIWEMHIWDSLSLGMILLFKLWLVLCCPNQTLVIVDYSSESDIPNCSVPPLQGTHFKLFHSLLKVLIVRLEVRRPYHTPTSLSK